MTATSRPATRAMAAVARPAGRLVARPAEDQGTPTPPPLRVVDVDELSPRARRRRTRWIAAATGLLLCAGLFGVVAFHVVLTQGQFRLDQLDNRVTQQQSEYDRLRLQVATLESPARIVAVAQERLGMVPPPSVRYLSPTNGSSVATAGKAPSTTATTAPRSAPTTAPAPAAVKPSGTSPAASHPTTASTTAPAKSGPATTTAPAKSGTTTVTSTTAVAHR